MTLGRKVELTEEHNRVYFVLSIFSESLLAEKHSLICKSSEFIALNNIAIILLRYKQISIVEFRCFMDLKISFT